jgi:FKBP-type peptidyl-prolyl cis-trans isomerase FklB
MKKLLATLSVTTLFLSACGSPEPTAEELAALAVCPAENIINDVSVYPNDMPDASLEREAWLEANGARNGVVTTESGLQYSVVRSGNKNGPSPVGSQTIKVNYHGFFPNGEVFDSSYQRSQPIEFPANGVIKGWIEGLGKMKPCDAWTLYIPGDLAYGPSGRGGIPPNATLVFHVQLLEVKE